MMKATDLYKNLAEFQQYAEGFTADTSYEQLTPSIKTVTHEIFSIITANVYLALNGLDLQGNKTGNTKDVSEGLDLLKTAVACGTLYKYQIFSSIKKNGSDASLYKYQHEEIKQHHLEAYWSAMDRLLDWLDENPDVGDWLNSKEYICRSMLPVKNASEFDFYYGIGKSSFFYRKVLFLIREIWQFDVRRLVGGFTDNDKIMELAKHILCYKVMAKAVMQFDVTELPRSIKYDNNHEYSKESSMQNRTTLFNQLTSQIEIWVKSVQTLKKTFTGSTLMSESDNAKNKKYYSSL